MSEKPEKQLVSKGQYVRVMGEKVTWVTVSALLAVLGMFACFWTMKLFSNDWCAAFCLGPAAFALLVNARVAFKAAKTIEPVTPITDKNVHHRPAHEILLRGSDLPPTVQQA